MPRKTVLDLTQRILSALDYDPVNSINDTTEAKQVAVIIKNCYRDIAAELELSSQGEMRTLDDATSDIRPTMLKIPPDVAQIEWINYGIGEPAPAGPDVAPVLIIAEDNFSSLVIQWTAAEFGDGQAVSTYTLYRVSATGSLNPEDYDELSDFTVLTSVAGDVLTYEDSDGIDTFSNHYAYIVTADGASGGVLESNIEASQQPS